MKNFEKVVIILSIVVVLVFCFGVVKIEKADAAEEWTDITGDLNGRWSGNLVEVSDGLIFAGGHYYDGATYYAKIWRYSDGVWTDISSGLDGSFVSAMILGSDGSVYAGGNYFDGADDYARVWRYSGSSWLNITSDLNGANVNAMFQALDGSIYIGGNYCVGVDCSARVWKYMDDSWSNETYDLNGRSVYTLVQAENGSIYAGGHYYDGSHHARVWQYLDGSWVNITGDLSGTIDTMTCGADDSVYVSGYYTSESNNYARVWKYNNNDTWTDMMVGAGSYSRVSSLLEFNSILYAGGYESVGGGSAAKVWSYSNNVWSENILGTAASGWSNIGDLIQGSDGLYAGGFLGGVAKVWERAYTQEELEQMAQEEAQESLENGERIVLNEYLNDQSISGQNLDIYFKKLPNKLTKNDKYWMKWKKFNKYPPKWENKKQKTLKRYWKLTTNLNKYKRKKKKQKFQIQVIFKYNKKLFKKLRKKGIKKSDLSLKVKTAKSNWDQMNNFWKKIKVNHFENKNKFRVRYFTNFKKNKYWFGIGK